MAQSPTIKTARSELSGYLKSWEALGSMISRGRSFSGYEKNCVFLNTSTISPIPTALLEAMSCSCAVVSTATCMIPEIIEHGVDGFITNDEKEMREYLELLSSDEELALEMGKKARQKIVNHYSKEQFVNQWLDIFYEASKVTFRG